MSKRKIKMDQIYMEILSSNIPSGHVTLHNSLLYNLLI